MAQQSLKAKLLKCSVLVVAIGIVFNYNAIAGWIQEEMDNNMYLVERPVAIWHQTISQMKSLARNLMGSSGSSNRSAEAADNDPNRWDRQGHKPAEREYEVAVDEDAGKKRPKNADVEAAEDNGGSFVYNSAPDFSTAPERNASNAADNAGRTVSAAQQAYNDRDTADFNHRQARDGDPGAQYDLANAYYTGTGVEKNYNEAAGWYRKAAEHGVVPAQVALGTMYSNGDGVDRDYNQAVKYWRQAADLGNSDAAFHLGNAYHEGKGVPKDDAEAAKWWQKAADRGNAEAQKMLKRYAPPPAQ